MASAKLTARDVRRARDLAEWVLTESAKEGLDLDFARGEARHLLLALAPRRRPRRELMRAPGASVEQRRDERRKRAADIREAVFVRADGKCEFCETYEPTEWHHLLGAGLRRSREAVETSAAVCFGCHRDYHRNDYQTLSQALEWAHRRGYWTVAEAMVKRMAKIDETRSSERAGGERP